MKIILAVFLLIAFNVHAEEIKIGYLLDLTGKGAFMGVQSQAGALLAEKELREQGVPIKVIFEDHQTDAKVAVTKVKKLLNVDRVQGILCDLTPTSMAISPITYAAKKLFLYHAPVVSILKSNPYAFKSFLDYEKGCEEIAAKWKQNGLNKVAHLKINAEFGELCRNGAEKIFPDQFVFDYNGGDDLRSIIPRLKRDGVQAVFQTGYEGDYASWLLALSDANLVVPIGMPEPLLTEVVKKNATKFHGNIFTFGYPEVEKLFIEKLNPETLVNIESAEMAYRDVKLLATAIKKCGIVDFKCQSKHFEATGEWKDRARNYQIANNIK